MPLLEHWILEIHSFPHFFLHSLTYWAEILYMTFILWNSDQVQVSSIFIKKSAKNCLFPIFRFKKRHNSFKNWRKVTTLELDLKESYRYIQVFSSICQGRIQNHHCCRRLHWGVKRSKGVREGVTPLRNLHKNFEISKILWNLHKNGAFWVSFEVINTRY